LQDVPEAFETNEGTNHRRAKSPHDVFVIVKEYISSTQIAQQPLLAQTEENKLTFPLVTTRNTFHQKCHFPFKLALVVQTYSLTS